MSLRIIADKTTKSDNTALIVIEGDSPSEVSSLAARNLATSHAASMGVSRPGLGLGSGSYPVDAAGNPTQTASESNKYRYDYPIQGGL